MAVFIVVFCAFALVMLAMAVGVIFGRKSLQGSCGGLNNVGVERACGCVDVCKNEIDAKQDMEKSHHNPRPTKYLPQSK